MPTEERAATGAQALGAAPVGESIAIVGFLVVFDVDDVEPDPNCCSLGSRVSQLATITTPVKIPATIKG